MTGDLSISPVMPGFSMKNDQRVAQTSIGLRSTERNADMWARRQIQDSNAWCSDRMILRLFKDLLGFFELPWGLSGVHGRFLEIPWASFRNPLVVPWVSFSRPWGSLGGPQEPTGCPRGGAKAD